MPGQFLVRQTLGGSFLRNGDPAALRGPSDAFITDADTATAVDAASFTATVTDTETANALDAGENITTPVSGADTATAVDGEGSLTATLTDTDTATALESESLTAPITDADTATAVDGGESVTFFVTATETATTVDGGENITVVMASPPIVVPALPTFEPPTRGFTRTTDADERLVRANPLGNRLMRHFRGQPVGINIWVLADGTITEKEPFGDDLATIRTVYWGGHIATVSYAEANALVAAGYDVNFTNARYDMSQYDSGATYA